MRLFRHVLLLLVAGVLPGIALLGVATLRSVRRSRNPLPPLHAGTAWAAAAPYLVLDATRTDRRPVAPESMESFFPFVFSHLPEDVTVYPSENYFYFVVQLPERQIRGNIRLPAARRDEGVLCFAYAEFQDYPNALEPPLRKGRFFGAPDGVALHALDRATYQASYRGKTVRFHLHPLDQTPPTRLTTTADERFIERTLDESGVPFYLLFNSARRYFFWVLNEEQTVPDVWVPVGPDVVAGRRTGFVFWIDHSHDGRKVLAAVRRLSVLRNDYYDGPFDQLADNYAAQTRIADWIEKARPALKNRIDPFGYYLESPSPSRVALNCYGTYESLKEAAARIRKAATTADPIAVLASPRD